DIEVFAKEELEAAVRIGMPSGLKVVSETVEKPEYAAAVGLALMALNETRDTKAQGRVKSGGGKQAGSAGGFIKKLFKKF
ncbi:hypothetical protein IJG66_00670, partial [Candidatus Saccharibacteria bacterium]|nr:hypothetical protein [Candidatus Saccharibacteria bacterium]